jgi:hypothetical protein
MNKLKSLVLVPVLLFTAITTTQARDVHKYYPIYKADDLFCVKFEDRKEPLCKQTKEQLTQESSNEQYRDIMSMKRTLNSTEFNRAIVDTFVDNKLSVLEYEYLKMKAEVIKAKSGKTK